MLHVAVRSLPYFLSSLPLRDVTMPVIPGGACMGGCAISPVSTPIVSTSTSTAPVLVVSPPALLAASASASRLKASLLSSRMVNGFVGAASLSPSLVGTGNVAVKVGTGGEGGANVAVTGAST